MLLLAIVLLHDSGLAQKNFEEGYVVLNSQDTLFGHVKDRKPHPFGRLYKKIKFKGKRGKSNYRPKEILAYKKGGTIFESLWISNSGNLFDQNLISQEGIGAPVFLKVISQGYLTYYHLEFEDADSGNIDFIPYFKKEDDPNLIRASQGIFGLRRKALIPFFRECPSLAEKIRNKEIKDALEVARYYNDWKMGNEHLEQ